MLAIDKYGYHSLAMWVAFVAMLFICLRTIQVQRRITRSRQQHKRLVIKRVSRARK